MTFLSRWGWILALLLFSFTAFYSSGIDSGTSHDRLKYLSIAWSMYQNGDYLIPTVNGVPYTDKPPLLFWLIAGSWHLFGINMFGPQLVIMMNYIAWGFLTRAIYATLFPDDARGKDLAPYVLLGSFTLWQGTWFLRVDLLLVTGILLCNWGIIRLLVSLNTSLEKRKDFFSLFLISIGTCIGLFGKGPVIYIFTFFPFVISAFFIKNYRKFWLKITSATLIGSLLMGLVWAIPAAISMGCDFAKQIFYIQLTHRAVRTEVPPYVKRSYFIYLYQYLPALFLPWLVNVVFFRKIKVTFYAFGNAKFFIAAIFVISLFILSCFGQKSAWYILPLLPFGVLFFTRFFVKYEQALSVIWINRILLALCFLILGCVTLGLLFSPSLTHHVFKNFGGKFSLNSSLMSALALLSFLMFVFIYSSKSFLRLIKYTSIMFFLLYGVLNVYLSIFEKAYTKLEQVSNILSYQERSENGLLIYSVRPDGGYSEYLGQFNYSAHLTNTIQTSNNIDALRRWIRQHPRGVVIYQGHSCPAIGKLFKVAAYYERATSMPYLICQTADSNARAL